MRVAIFSRRGQGGEASKNRAANVLTPGVNLEKPGSTCLSQLLWEVLFGSENPEQQPRAASETNRLFSEMNRLFSENRTFGVFKAVYLQLPCGSLTLKGIKITEMFRAE